MRPAQSAGLSPVNEPEGRNRTADQAASSPGITDRAMAVRVPTSVCRALDRHGPAQHLVGSTRVVSDVPKML